MTCEEEEEGETRRANDQEFRFVSCLGRRRGSRRTCIPPKGRSLPLVSLASCSSLSTAMSATEKSQGSETATRLRSDEGEDSQSGPSIMELRTKRRVRCYAERQYKTIKKAYISSMTCLKERRASRLVLISFHRLHLTSSLQPRGKPRKQDDLY